MKNSIKAFLILSLFSLILLGNTSFAQTSAKNDVKFKKATYSVDVHCNSCKEKIGKALAYEKGVKEFTVDVDKKLVSVTYNPAKTNLEKIKKSISKLGYKPKLSSTKACCDKSHARSGSSCCKK